MADKSDKRQTPVPTPPKRGKNGGGTRPDDPQMGVALRSVYQKTVEEAVPDEMLDLLSKLG